MGTAAFCGTPLVTRLTGRGAGIRTACLLDGRTHTFSARRTRPRFLFVRPGDAVPRAKKRGAEILISAPLAS